MINLSGGQESLSKYLEDYRTAWRAFQVVHHMETLGHSARPTTLSWKVDSKRTLYLNLMALHADVRQVHIGTVNGRFIATALLAEPVDGMPLLKLLERREGSADPLGLDSIDYLVTDLRKTLNLLKSSGARVLEESNDMHAWLSLRFGKNLEFEAKFSEDVGLDIAMKELKVARENLFASDDDWV